MVVKMTLLKGGNMKRIFIAALLATSSVHAHFFLPEEMIHSHLKSYTEEEKTAIQKDLAVVKSVCFPTHLEAKKHPVYLATAGSPGTRKSTILEKFLHNNAAYTDCVYLDPDTRTLKYMVHTYISRSLSPYVVAETGDYNLVVKNGYEKWRGASLYISGMLIEEVLGHQADFAHGTTLTGDVVSSLLQKLKEKGYEITLLLCSATDDFRVASVRYRNEVTRFYQSSPEDILSKGKLFPQRLKTYFTYADKLYFYWSDALSETERLAATYDRGKLRVQDMEAWNLFAQKYEMDRESLRTEGKDIPSWEEQIAYLTHR